MKTTKNQIQLSKAHPSLLLDLQHQTVEFIAPLIVNETGVLVDGYRRYQLLGEEVEVIRIPTSRIFEPALELNQRTRIWDESDCLLWHKWAMSLGIEKPRFPGEPYSTDLLDFDTYWWRLVAQRKLLPRQVSILSNAPRRYQRFLGEILTELIQLNANETRDFVEMVSDLSNQRKDREIKSLFEMSPISLILADGSLTPKQRGERLLREVRVLRYPYYQQQLSEFSGIWKELELESEFHARRNAFIERGVLELSFSANSLQEMRKRVGKLYRSLDSSLWKKVWEDK
jgi:hypothetical protein